MDKRLEIFGDVKRATILLTILVATSFVFLKVARGEWLKLWRQGSWQRHSNNFSAPPDENYAKTLGPLWPVIRAVRDRVPENGRIAWLAPTPGGTDQKNLQVAFLVHPRPVRDYDAMIRYYKEHLEEMDGRNFVLDLDPVRDPDFPDLFTEVASGGGWRLLRFKGIK